MVRRNIMSQIQVTDYKHPGGWTDAAAARQSAIDYCRQLEEGGILYFDNVPYDFPDADREFLLSQKQSGLRIHKNISYRPKTDTLRGSAADDPEGTKRLHEIMRHFSQEIIRLVDTFLSPYAKHRTLDFASYRPNEEKGRDLSYHKRNDLMHVDAFPTRPTNGGRILRVFTNINPSVNRVWEVTEPFEPLANKLAIAAGLGQIRRVCDLRLAQAAPDGRPDPTDGGSEKRRSIAVRSLHASFPRLAEGKPRVSGEVAEDSHRVSALFHMDGLHRHGAALGFIGTVRVGADIHRAGERHGRTGKDAAEIARGNLRDGAGELN